MRDARAGAGRRRRIFGPFAHNPAGKHARQLFPGAANAQI